MLEILKPLKFQKLKSIGWGLLVWCFVMPKEVITKKSAWQGFAKKHLIFLDYYLSFRALLEKIMSTKSLHEELEHLVKKQYQSVDALESVIVSVSDKLDGDLGDLQECFTVSTSYPGLKVIENSGKIY